MDTAIVDETFSRTQALGGIRAFAADSATLATLHTKSNLRYRYELYTDQHLELELRRQDLDDDGTVRLGVLELSPILGAKSAILSMDALLQPTADNGGAEPCPGDRLLVMGFEAQEANFANPNPNSEGVRLSAIDLRPWLDSGDQPDDPRLVWDTRLCRDFQTVGFVGDIRSMHTSAADTDSLFIAAGQGALRLDMATGRITNASGYGTWEELMDNSSVECVGATPDAASPFTYTSAWSGSPHDLSSSELVRCDFRAEAASTCCFTTGHASVRRVRPTAVDEQVLTSHGRCKDIELWDWRVATSALSPGTHARPVRSWHCAGNGPDFDYDARSRRLAAVSAGPPGASYGCKLYMFSDDESVAGDPVGGGSAQPDAPARGDGGEICWAPLRAETKLSEIIIDDFAYRMNLPRGVALTPRAVHLAADSKRLITCRVPTR